MINKIKWFMELLKKIEIDTIQFCVQIYFGFYCKMNVSNWTQSLISIRSQTRVCKLAAHRVYATVANGDCVEIGLKIAILFIYLWCHNEFVIGTAKTAVVRMDLTWKYYNIHKWTGLQCCRIQCTTNHGLVFHQLKSKMKS